MQTEANGNVLNGARQCHTPGPWVVKVGADERDFIVAEHGGNTIAEPNVELFDDWSKLDPSVRHISVAEAMANAHLIAAAPDLYAAMSNAMEVLESTFGRCDADCTCLLHSFHVALAKAEGR